VYAIGKKVWNGYIDKLANGMIETNAIQIPRLQNVARNFCESSGTIVDKNEGMISF
jgi:hypothetical protein